MRTRLFFLFLFIWVLPGITHAQTCPPNLDFEAGSFSSWQCFTGNTELDNTTFRNKINLNPTDPTAGRHEIIKASSSSAKDPYGNFPVMCPYGGCYSVKLGNNVPGAEAEGLSYTFTVPSTVDTFTFTYFYAVVFEDPGHSAEEQPRFFVTAYDVESGALINCASYNYVSNGVLPGFQVSPLRSNTLYRDWSPTSLQFAGMAGRKVRLEFRTADCTLGGHFGYAYVDVGSACSNIMATAPYCQETNSLILNAPYGFKTYTWYTQDFSTVIGSEQSLTLSPPPLTSGAFYVDVEPYPGFGCRDTLQAIVKPLPVPDTPVAPSLVYRCQFAIPEPLTAVAQPGNELIWYTTPTGGTGSFFAPKPPTHQPGAYIYYVTQKVLFGCESFRKKIRVQVIPTPVTSFTLNKDRHCLNGNQLNGRSTATNRFSAEFSWDFGDGTIIQSEKDYIVNYTFRTAGHYPVRLKVTNGGTCSSEAVQLVTIIPKPEARFDHPAVICEAQTPLTFADRSHVPNGLSIINQWWWNIDGQVVRNGTPSSFLPNKPGNLPVELVVTTNEGCRSDTFRTSVPVRHRPTAAFRYPGLMCDNETLRFTNTSFIAQTPPGETITRWQWNWNGTIRSGSEHPALHLPAGTHTVSLVAETGYGCQSTPLVQALTVHPKPQIGLQISDSCVHRPISFEAADLRQTVDKWYWNFGGVLKEGRAMVNRTFGKEVQLQLTLMGKTGEGCKDTLNRTYTVYRNKAFAGRDTVAAMLEPVQLHANGGGRVSYTWTPATGLSNSSIENPVAILDHDQVYQLDAISAEGCDAHSQILIKRYKGPDIYIPSGFTPNRDGHNDGLAVFPVGIKAFHFMAVYNRYGELLFRTTDPETAWDGTYKGSNLPTGTFVVVAEATDYRGKLLQRKNTVTLIR